MKWKMTVLVAAVCAGCGGDAAQSDAAARDTLTREQRDSVIGASSLPGAGVVRRADGVRDTANARAAAMDSLLQN